MAERVAWIDFSKSPKAFRPIALEPGYPLLDRQNANARIVSKWLGRLAAEPERKGESISWYVRSEQGARLDGVTVCPISPKDLKGSLRNELKELEKRVDAAQPRTKAEQAVHRTIKDNLAHLVQNAHRPENDSDFLKYQDEAGKWRLLWMWGYERIESSPAPTAICTNRECRALFVDSPSANGQCPHCKTALPIPPNPWKRLAIAAAVLLLLGGAGFGGWWYSQPRAAIKGIVLWSGNNQPVANADVTLPEWGLSVRTDESGQFQFTRLPEGEAGLEIAAEGYHPHSQAETLMAGEETSLKILLDGNGSLAGRVLNGVSNMPLDDAQIQIAGTDIRTQSDDEGRFQIEGLPVGPHRLSIKAAGFPEKEEVMELSAGSPAEMTVRLTGEGLLSGVVLQANGEQPISGAKAEIVGTGQSAEADADGVFVIRQLPTGSAKLEVTADGFALQRLDVVVDRKERSQRILLLGAGILSGTITTAEGDKPIAGASVRIEGTGQSALTNTSGKYSLAGIPAGLVKAIVSAPGYRTGMFDKLIESGKQTPLDARLEGAAVLAGVVIDGTTDKPLANAEVRISSYATPLRTNEVGAFKVEDIKAGPAIIEAKAPGFQPVKASKTLEPGQETKVELKLAGDAALVGTLLDAQTKKPIAEADLKIAGTILSGKTGRDGRIEIPGVRSGSVKVEVQAKGYPPMNFAARLAPGRNDEQQWTLTGGSALAGTVEDLARGVPVANAIVTLQGTEVSVKTDAQGEFRLEKLPALPVKLEVAAEGYKTKSIEQQVSKGEPATVTIRLGGDAVIAGEVFDALTKQPISNATIAIGKHLSTRTDPKGQFRLEDVFPGKNDVAITSADYPPAAETVAVESKTVHKLSIGLTGSAIAKGTVLDEAGDPIAGATIKRPGSKHQTQTDAGGVFELDKLPGGKITLEVSAKNYKTQNLAGQFQSGEKTTLPAAKLASGLNVTGKVISALDGKGVNNAKLTVQGADISASTDEAGGFELASVPVGEFFVEVAAPRFYPETLQVDSASGELEIKPVLAPMLKAGEVRIVLLWGGRFQDLDLHIYAPDGGHVSFRNRQIPGVKLDVDNRNGFGPETITMTSAGRGTYQVFVQANKDPQNPIPNIGQSQAEVRIYQAGKKTGQILKVRMGPNANNPVWNPGAIEIPAEGEPIVHEYDRLNYREQLP